jgi:hypothetical protein
MAFLLTAKTMLSNAPRKADDRKTPLEVMSVSQGNNVEVTMPRATIALCLALLALPGQIVAQGKGIRLWNLTTSTISGFQLSPAGKNDWGPNQTLNDKDKEVDHDERLRITGIEPGRYDAKVGYRDNRQCMVRDIEIKADAVFSIQDKDLKDCNK